MSHQNPSVPVSVCFRIELDDEVCWVGRETLHMNPHMPYRTMSPERVLGVEVPLVLAALSRRLVVCSAELSGEKV